MAKRKTEMKVAGPGPVAAAVERARTFLQSKDLKLEYDEREPDPARRSMRTGGQRGDAEFLAESATAEELRLFKAAVQARIAKDPETWIWRRCDNPLCRRVSKMEPRFLEGEACAICNHAGRADLGHMRTMSEAEVSAYLKDKTARDAADLERMRAANFHATNAGRAKGGLPPITREQFDEKSRQDFREMLVRQENMNKVANICRRPL